MRFIALFFFFSAFAGSIQEDMIRDLEVAAYNISTKYAPVEWKEKQFGWNLKEKLGEAKQRIYAEDCQTSKHYHKIFKDFLASMKDYHVKCLFHSTEMAYCPISVERAEGRYFFQFCPLTAMNELPMIELIYLLEEIIKIGDKALELPPIAVGDELIAFNGIPIATCIESLIDEELGGDRTDTGYALAERMLFFRRGKYAEKMPGKTFSLTVKHQGSRRNATYKLPWICVPEYISNRALPKKELKEMQLLNRDYSAPFAADLPNYNAQSDSEDVRCKSFLPPLGKIIWETEKDEEKNPFGIYAYLYQHPKGKKVGYLHLGSFHYLDTLGEILCKQLGAILTVFDKYTDALVLDINGNTGGNLTFMYGVLSMLTDRPLETIKEKETLIPEDISRVVSFNKILSLLEEDKDDELRTLSGLVVTERIFEDIREYSDDVLLAWNEGKSMTDLIYPLGIGQIFPHPEVRYTKPILLLQNEMCFSCADFFPAILRDNNRVTLFGNTTAGAGGLVFPLQYSSRFGVDLFTLTGSIGYRSNGMPIENIGVKPDIQYKLTIQDLKKGYVDYIKAVNKAL